MKLSKEQKDILKAIFELIEDKTYPARRNISDYVVLLLPVELHKEAYDYFESKYKTLEESN